jgi:hypothetical protein
VEVWHFDDSKCLLFDGLNRLVASRGSSRHPVTLNLRQIESHGDHFNLSDFELFTETQKLAIHDNKGAAVEQCPLAVAAFAIRVDHNATDSISICEKDIRTVDEFPRLMAGPGSVKDDMRTLEVQLRGDRVRCPSLATYVPSN